jgi:hypothetical protein
MFKHFSQQTNTPPCGGVVTRVQYRTLLFMVTMHRLRRIHHVACGQSHDGDAYEDANHSNRMVKYKSAQQPQDRGYDYR